jgi:hypothetical protein
MYGGSSTGSKEARRIEAERQARINAGMADIDRQFAGYDEPFYDRRKADYVNYAMPILNLQAGDARRGLAYALARRGLLNSGAAVVGDQSLRRETTTRTRDVADAGQAEANKLRAAVADQRGNLVSQLVASGDPSVVARQATSVAGQLRAPSTFAPLGNMFDDWTRMNLANQTARAYQEPGAPVMWSFGRGGGGSSQRIVR